MQSPREAIIEYLVSTYTAIQSGVNNYTQSYRFVTRDPITQDQVERLGTNEAMVGVYELAESKTRLFNLSECKLTIMIEFYYRPNEFTSTSAASNLDRLMTELEKATLTDYTLGSKAINTEPMSNQIDIDGIYDKIVNGSITFEVTYRTAMFDPTIPVN
jgi:hypothetical protein